MTLRELKPGQSGRVEVVGGSGALRQHFLDMGVIPGAEVTLVKLAPMGDPMELRIHGYELTLRLADAQRIEATLIDRLTERIEPPLPRTSSIMFSASTIGTSSSISCMVRYRLRSIFVASTMLMMPVGFSLRMNRRDTRSSSE